MSTPPRAPFFPAIPQLQTEEFTRLSELITRRVGLQMPERNLALLNARLRQRVSDLGLGSFAPYLRLLEQPQHQEWNHVLSAVTTNKTEFFREADHFSFLEREVLPRLAPAVAGQRLLKGWSAGCSSGEEAFSLAMTLQAFRTRHALLDFRLLATDVSPRVLELGRRAVYPIAALNSVPEDLRRTYFLRGLPPQEDSVKPISLLRERIQFHALNLMDAAYPLDDTFDFIFFRNVAIYFDQPTRQSVIEKLCRHLRPGGYLFIGHSESLGNIRHSLTPVQPAVFVAPA